MNDLDIIKFVARLLTIALGMSGVLLFVGLLCLLLVRALSAIARWSLRLLLSKQREVKSATARSTAEQRSGVRGS